MVQGGCFFLSGCSSLRSVIVENSSGQSASTSTSELLKPMKKRKRREYHSPSEEESEPEALVGRGQWRGRGEAGDYVSISTVLSVNPGCGAGPEMTRDDSLIILLGSHFDSGPVLEEYRVEVKAPSCFLELPCQSSVRAVSHSCKPAPK